MPVGSVPHVIRSHSSATSYRWRLRPRSRRSSQTTVRTTGSSQQEASLMPWEISSPAASLHRYESTARTSSQILHRRSLGFSAFQPDSGSITMNHSGTARLLPAKTSSLNRVSKDSWLITSSNSTVGRFPNRKSGSRSATRGVTRASGDSPIGSLLSPGANVGWRTPTQDGWNRHLHGTADRCL